MANHNVNVSLELDKISSGFGMISMKLDECKLSEIAKRTVIIVDHARALKENGLISPTDYLKIIDRVNGYIDDSDKKCICNNR